MNSRAAVLAIALTITLASCGGGDDAGGDRLTAADCPRAAAVDESYTGRFQGVLRMSDEEELLQLRHGGRPLDAASVCVRTSMPAMAGMDATATGRAVAPGRYRVGLRFAMAGRYRAEVFARQAGRPIAIPLTFKVSPSNAGGSRSATEAMVPLVAGADGTRASAGGLTLHVDRTRAPGRRAVVWRLRVSGARGRTITRFDREQTKLMHLIVVGEDLTGYQHLHPVLHPDGSFTIAVTLPAAGRYRAIADFATKGRRYALGATITARGPAHAVALPAPSPTAGVDGYTVTLAHGGLRAGTAAELAFQVRRAGRPVTALQPYLGAFGHLVALRRTDLAYTHVHPIRRDARAARILFHAEFATRGTYRLFLQFRAGGAVHTAPFTVRVDR